METYKEFLNRIDSFEKKQLQLGSNDFVCNQSLSQKVGKGNTFNNFYGDTVVFALDGDTKSQLCGYVDLLYKTVPECFCERLVPDTFHITLHDLSNSPSLNCVEKEITENQSKILQLKPELQEFEKSEIRMKSKFVFNMVNTSLVLGFYPADEKSYCDVMRLYCIFDRVKKLNYPFTPHVTLAYYNIDGFGLKSVRALENTVNSLNSGINFIIRLKDLYYQKFKNMNSYTNIIKLL